MKIEDAVAKAKEIRSNDMQRMVEIIDSLRARRGKDAAAMVALFMRNYMLSCDVLDIILSRECLGEARFTLCRDIEERFKDQGSEAMAMLCMAHNFVGAVNDELMEVSRGLVNSHIKAREDANAVVSMASKQQGDC